MKKLSEDKIKSLASDLMFNVSEEEVKTIANNADAFLHQCMLLSEIATEGVEILSYPFETVQTSLREDIIGDVLSVEEAFLNAPKTEGDYFEIVQVIDK